MSIIGVLLLVGVFLFVLVPIYVEWVIDNGKVAEHIFLWLTLVNLIILFITN